MSKRKVRRKSSTPRTCLTSPAQDRKWRAESDARTLAEAEAIKMDKPRLNLARKEAKTMAADKVREAAAMKKIAGAEGLLIDPQKTKKEK